MLPFPDTALNEAQRRLLTALFNPETPPLERFQAGHRLAQIGDPRPGVGIRRGQGNCPIPAIDWCEIPGGEFIYQDGRKFTSLPTFYIARYPITVMQYAAFVQSDGYRNPSYWTKAGWAWCQGRTQPELWESPKWRVPNQPVVGVTWHEASAFCCWLALQLGLDGDLLRLPSEVEWEKAGRGTDGRVYPWGKYPVSGYANFNETYAYHFVGENFLKRATAVGIFPQDLSPYGVADMGGNVREWCFTPFHHMGRVLRGGGWFSNSYQARLIYRDWFYPDNSDHSIGFRVMALCHPESARNRLSYS